MKKLHIQYNSPVVLSFALLSLAALLLVIGGINMVLIGMIGEYVGRIYLLNNCIPQYVIRTVVGAEEEEDSHPAGQNRGQRPCN